VARSENGCGKWHFFGLKLGVDLEMRAAHPHQIFQGVPPSGVLSLSRRTVRYCSQKMKMVTVYGYCLLTTGFVALYSKWEKWALRGLTGWKRVLDSRELAQSNSLAAG